MEVRQLKCFFPGAVALHNLEELIFLPSWLAKGSMPLPFALPSPPQFQFAVAVITLLAMAITLASHRAGDRGFYFHCLLGFSGAMGLNALIPHLLGTLTMWAYAPGVITGVILNLPFTIFLIGAGLKEGRIHKKQVVIFTFGAGIFLSALIPTLFKTAQF